MSLFRRTAAPASILGVALGIPLCSCSDGDVYMLYERTAEPARTSEGVAAIEATPSIRPLTRETERLVGHDNQARPRLTRAPAAPVSTYAPERGPGSLFDEIRGLGASLALFAEPTEEGLAAWHQGRDLAGLSRSAHDAEEALHWLAARAAAPERFTHLPRVDGAVREWQDRAPSLESERAWLLAEIERRIALPPRVPSTGLHLLTAEELEALYPTRRERFALRAVLRHEVNELAVRAAADELDEQRGKLWSDGLSPQGFSLG